MLASLACLGVGTILDTLLMPINKSLWTPPFCLLMTGRAAMVFAAPFVIYGCSMPACSRRPGACGGEDGW
jgi:predicted acyltransferase